MKQRVGYLGIDIVGIQVFLGIEGHRSPTSWTPNPPPWTRTTLWRSCEEQKSSRSSALTFNDIWDGKMYISGRDFDILWFLLLALLHWIPAQNALLSTKTRSRRLRLRMIITTGCNWCGFLESTLGCQAFAFFSFQAYNITLLAFLFFLLLSLTFLALTWGEASALLLRVDISCEKLISTYLLQVH